MSLAEKDCLFSKFFGSKQGNKHGADFLLKYTLVDVICHPGSEQIFSDGNFNMLFA
jgi:hypothetical protein